MRSFLRVIASVFLLAQICVVRVCYAWPPTFGAEFNFSSLDIVSSKGRDKMEKIAEARERMVHEIERVCRLRQDCSVVRTQGNNYRVVYQDGWWFQLSMDISVVEIQTKPSTVAELKKHRDRIQNDIFMAAQDAQLSSAARIQGKKWASGHIHQGLTSTFDEDALFFRNALIDNANHPELASGIFTHDWLNAPPLFSLDEDLRDEFHKVIGEFDENKSGNRSIQSLVDELTSRVYEGQEKYNAFNVKRIHSSEIPLDEKTVENRGFPAQESADDFIIETELIHRRMEFIREDPEPIAVEFVDPEKLSERDKAARFYEYVSDTKLDFKPYEKFLSVEQKKYLPEIAAEYKRTAPARLAARKARIEAANARIKIEQERVSRVSCKTGVLWRLLKLGRR